MSQPRVRVGVSTQREVTPARPIIGNNTDSAVEKWSYPVTLGHVLIYESMSGLKGPFWSSWVEDTADIFQYIESMEERVNECKDSNNTTLPDLP